MKICRFDNDRLGVVLDDSVADVTEALETLPLSRYPLPRHDQFIAHLADIRSVIEVTLPHARRIALSSVRLLSPVANPGKLIAAPVNYVQHLREVLNDASLHHHNSINQIEHAGLFLKATSSLVGCSEGIEINQPDRRTDHEVELAIVVGRKAKDIAAADALAYVAGYCIGLDITIRGPEERSMRKSPDSYSILGPWLVTADELPDASDLSFELMVNGERRQASNTRDLILGVPALIEFATRFYTLHPGDVIFTGTPQGVGPIKAGDVVEARIERIGDMRVAVRAASDRGYP